MRQQSLPADRPWRVFVSHTVELSEHPRGSSYVDAVGESISACGHVVVEMGGFPARDESPAAVCERAVGRCGLYVGVLAARYGSPVRDRPAVSYTELEFDRATQLGLPRL